MTIGDIFADPDGVARRLLVTPAPEQLVGIRLAGADRQAVVFHVVLEPWPVLHDEGFPTEELGILVLRTGEVFARPLDGSIRVWKHRYPEVLDASVPPGRAPMIGQLCLWFPGDPRSERWVAEDGLVAFLEIAHRHVLAEECWRRSGRRTWPGREAPHGWPAATQSGRAA